MKKYRFVSIAVVASICLCLTGGVLADEGDCTSYGTDYCFNVTSGDWDVSTNWVYSGGGNGVPGASDTCTIPAGRVVTVDTSEACKSFNVEVDGADRGEIFIKKGGVLDLAQILSVSTLNGDLTFSDTGSGNDPKLLISANHEIQETIQGSGLITGPDGTQVVIESDHATLSQYRLTLDGVTMQGAFTIKSQFTNDGVVDSNHANDEIELAAGSDPKGTGEWKVTDADARLQFLDDAITLTSGAFTIQGRLIVDDDVTTTGNLVLEQNGKVEVASGVTFKAGL